MKKQAANRIYRFILRNTRIENLLAVGQEFILESNLEPEIFFQLTTVFRCQIGDQVRLLNPNTDQKANNLYLFKLIKVAKKRLHLQLLEQQHLSEKFDYKLELAFALPNKPAKLDFILQKSTELCATKIHLIKMERSQMLHQLKFDRLNKILIEAAEQTERISIPELIYYETFNKFISLTDCQNLLVALERSSATSENLLTIKLPPNPILLIGPEGGISQSEIDLLNQKGTQAYNLGGTILRMDTACLLSLGIAALRMNH